VFWQNENIPFKGVVSFFVGGVGSGGMAVVLFGEAVGRSGHLLCSQAGTLVCSFLPTIC
jgi:hypothetical protein